MSATTVPRNPMLADNEKTVEFIKGFAGGDEKQIAEIEEWGKRRQGRIDRLCLFVGFLEQNKLLRKDGKELVGIMREFAATQCFAIATVHNLDGMEYKFNDSQSGPICAALHLDFEAVKAKKPPTSLFANPEDEKRFLETVRGKDRRELGRMARSLVIKKRYRKYD